MDSAEFEIEESSEIDESSSDFGSLGALAPAWREGDAISEEEALEMFYEWLAEHEIDPHGGRSRYFGNANRLREVDGRHRHDVHGIVLGQTRVLHGSHQSARKRKVFRLGEYVGA